MYGKEEGRQKMKKDYDEIRIEDLEVFANHGVFPEENVLGQKFLHLNYTKAKQSVRQLRLPVLQS